MQLRIGNNVALRTGASGRGTIIDFVLREEGPWLVEWDDSSSSWHPDDELDFHPLGHGGDGLESRRFT